MVLLGSSMPDYPNLQKMGKYIYFPIIISFLALRLAEFPRLSVAARLQLLRNHLPACRLVCPADRSCKRCSTAHRIDYTRCREVYILPDTPKFTTEAVARAPHGTTQASQKPSAQARFASNPTRVNWPWFLGQAQQQSIAQAAVSRLRGQGGEAPIVNG